MTVHIGNATLAGVGTISAYTGLRHFIDYGERVGLGLWHVDGGTSHLHAATVQIHVATAQLRGAGGLRASWLDDFFAWSVLQIHKRDRVPARNANLVGTARPVARRNLTIAP
jgi:hypothetical protein